MSKLFILGIDGASLKLIERWQDELPNLRRIMENGVYGELESTMPPITCPAWPCMFTGKNPGKIGIYDFVVPSFSHAGPTLHSSLSYSAQSLWQILSDSDKKIGLLNVPVTYPPPRVDGFSVSGFGAPLAETMKKDYIYPASLREELDRVVGGYEVEPPIDVRLKGKEKHYIAALDDMLKKKLKAAKYLMANSEWDLFICVFAVLDRVQHYFWQHMDKTHPCHTGEEYQPVIKDFYKKVDLAAGELFDMLPEKTNVLVASDHGFQAEHGQFLINTWLKKKGFMNLNKDTRLVSNCVRIVRNSFLRVSSPELTRFVSKIIPQKILAKLLSVSGAGGMLSNIFSRIDWPLTKAFALGGGGSGGMIFMNVKGIRPNGIVIPGDEYEAIRKDIITGLKDLRNPRTGELLDIKIYKKEEIYHGSHLEIAPDIVFLINQYGAQATIGETTLEWQEELPSGMHALEGIFMAYGPDISQRGQKFLNLKIYDITPTALHMFGLPVARDMDGRVLTEIFKEDSPLAQRPVEYRELDEANRVKSKIAALKKSKLI